jgi:hypothetical protein
MEFSLFMNLLLIASQTAIQTVRTIYLQCNSTSHICMFTHYRVIYDTEVLRRRLQTYGTN